YLVYKHYVDHVAPKILWPIFMIDVVKLKFWEMYFWKKTNRLVSVSSEDKKVMQRLVKNISVDIVPNGVDSHFYSSKKVSKKTPPRVMYGVTNFEWLQNVEAVDVLLNEVWPAIHTMHKNAILWIVGRKIPQRIRELASARDDIEITESIKDARNAYLGASVMVTPIKGSGGTRLKILEAMAAGLPIVSTSTGVAGLDVTHEENVLISDSSKGLAKETIRLLENGSLAKKIGTAGKKFVADNFDWRQIVKLHNPIYKAAIERK
ncbi:MAG: glycosyltransferase family 4 protein, partial [Patescibacteria group bacterium]